MLLITNQPKYITKDYVIHIYIYNIHAKHYFIYI